MKIPGFIAEASIGRTGKYNHMTESLEQINEEVQMATQVVETPKAIAGPIAIDLSKLRCIRWGCIRFGYDKNGWPYCREYGFFNVC